MYSLGDFLSSEVYPKICQRRMVHGRELWHVALQGHCPGAASARDECREGITSDEPRLSIKRAMSADDDSEMTSG